MPSSLAASQPARSCAWWRTRYDACAHNDTCECNSQQCTHSPHAALKPPRCRLLQMQTVWAPTGLVLCFLSLGAMETGRLQTGMDRTRENFFPVLVRNWMIWPAVQFMNFKYLPPQFQVLFVNFVSFFWSMYVSNMANAQASAPDRQEAGTATTKPVLLDGEVVVDGRVAANAPARGDIPAVAAPTSTAASVAR
ncbi:MAG: Mpv17/PMP22 family protein [Methanobacteriota archaeon]|nr:MAG: Mpv17/PMP22 family protein [Euryarchaeota archaeon]